jgi:hypothetical protein
VADGVESVDGSGLSIATYFRMCSMPLVNWLRGTFDLTGNVVSIWGSSAIFWDEMCWFVMLISLIR